MHGVYGTFCFCGADVSERPIHTTLKYLQLWAFPIVRLGLSCRPQELRYVDNRVQLHARYGLEPHVLQ